VGEEGWVPAVVLGLVLLAYNEWRVWLVQRHPDSPAPPQP